jgi:hypothetical protein
MAVAGTDGVITIRSTEAITAALGTIGGIMIRFIVASMEAFMAVGTILVFMPLIDTTTIIMGTDIMVRAMFHTVLADVTHIHQTT